MNRDEFEQRLADYGSTRDPALRRRLHNHDHQQRTRIEECEVVLDAIATRCQEAIDADEDSLIHWPAALAYSVAAARVLIPAVPPSVCPTCGSTKPEEEAWLCARCGYGERNSAEWCGLGCGRDYVSMNRCLDSWHACPTCGVDDPSMCGIGAMSPHLHSAGVGANIECCPDAFHRDGSEDVDGTD